MCACRDFGVLMHVLKAFQQPAAAGDNVRLEVFDEEELDIYDDSPLFAPTLATMPSMLSTKPAKNNA